MGLATAQHILRVGGVGTPTVDFAFTTLRDTNNEPVQVIPEPGTWLGAALAGVGLMGLIGWRRSQRLG